MKAWVILIATLIFSKLPNAQFVPTAALKMTAVCPGVNDYIALGEVYNLNETIDYYVIHNKIGPLVGEACLRGFGRNFMSDKAFTPGYSLEFGFQQYRSDGKFVYLHSSTENPDSIVNDYDGFHYKTDFTNLFVRHYFDLNWNLSDDLKWTNSLGFGVRAMIRAGAMDLYDASIIDNDRPIVFLFNYDTQLTEKYTHFDVGYFLSFDLMALSMFKDDLTSYDPRIKMKNVRFYGFGLRFVPHPKRKKKESH